MSLLHQKLVLKQGRLPQEFARRAIDPGDHSVLEYREGVVKRAHYSASARISGVEVGLALEADAGQVRHRDVAVLDPHAVGKAAVGLEQIRIALVAAEPEAGRDVERHLVAAVRNAAASATSRTVRARRACADIRTAVRQRAVELQPVAVRPHAAVAQQIARVLVAEQVLAGRHRPRIELGERGLQLIVERIARLLVPEQRIVAQHLGVGDRRSPDRSGRSRRPRAAPASRSPRAPPRCGGGPRRSARRRSSSSRRCSRGRDSRASRRAARRCPCRDSSSRRPHRRRRADWPRGPCAPPAGGTAACRRSSPPRPRSPCRWCRPPPSARRGRRAFRWSSSPPRSCADRGCRRCRSSRLSGSASRMRSRNRSRISPPWP